MRKKAIALIITFLVFCTALPFQGYVYASDMQSDDYLHVNGNQIVDDNGNKVHLTGIAWFGLETPNYTYHGIWANSLENMLDIVADNGFNLLRVPLSVELVNQWRKGTPPQPESIDYVNNPNLKGKNSLEVFDASVAYCKKNGLKMMLDMHRISSGGQTPTWSTDKYSTEDFEACWQWLAERYKNDDTVIAMDLFNEPHGKAYWGEGAKWDGSTDADNWKYEAEKVGKQILNINPKLLIVVEGIECYPKEGYTYTSTAPENYYGYWWGGNLRGVADFPVKLGSQVIYSPHDYGPSVSAQPWFEGTFDEQTLTRDAWEPNWFYIHEKNLAPILIGEWGGQMDGGKNEKWMRALASLISKNNLNHTFWCLNANSGDTGGILQYDFKTIDTAKLALVQPTLWKDSNGKYIGLDHQVNLGKTGTHVGGGTVEVLMGDVNGDKTFDALDLASIKAYLLNPSTVISLKAADYNEDGGVNALDYAAIKIALLHPPIH